MSDDDPQRSWCCDRSTVSIVVYAASSLPSERILILNSLMQCFENICVRICVCVWMIGAAEKWE